MNEPKKTNRREFLKDSMKGLSVFALTITGCEMAQPQRKGQTNETDLLQEVPAIETPAPQPQRIAPPAEQAGFTEREQREIENIKRELMNPNNPSRVNTNNVQRMRLVEEAIRQIDPTLIGRNVLFGPRWLEVVGPGKPIPPQPFQQWRDRLDVVYEKFADLIGQGPGQQGEMQKTMIELFPRASFRTSLIAGSAASNMALINKDHPLFIKEQVPGIVWHNSLNVVLLHELAHCFTIGKRFTYDAEAICDLLTAYALESIRGASVGRPGGVGKHELLVGDQFRKQYLEGIQTRVRQNPNQIPTSTDGGGLSANVYMSLSPVDAVGWEPYKQVFRSYNDENYTHQFRYSGGSSAVRRAREFFDRLAHFSGKPDLMASLPDRGQIFDRHFGAGAGIVATARTTTPATAARTTAPSTATQNTGTQQMSTAP